MNPMWETILIAVGFYAILALIAILFNKVRRDDNGR
jgi:hypothetical protein